MKGDKTLHGIPFRYGGLWHKYNLNYCEITGDDKAKCYVCGGLMTHTVMLTTGKPMNPQPPQHPYIASYYISKGREKGYYRFHPLCRAGAYAYERGVIEMNGNTYQEPDELNEEKYKKEIGYKAEDEEDDKG